MSRVYNITRDCWWYFPATDKWKKGPRMLTPKYEAVAVDLSGPSSGGKHPGGQVWMTGGRDGSTILQVSSALLQSNWSMGATADIGIYMTRLTHLNIERATTTKQ